MLTVLIGAPGAGKSTVGALLAAHPRAVLALGAGHSHLETPDLFARLAVALRPASQVVLLRPAPDARRSWEVLRSRCLLTEGHDWRVDGVDWLERWLGDGRDEQLATDVVHTGDDDPGTTARRVAALDPGRRA